MSQNYILLTGSTGFIGQYLMNYFLRTGRRVAVLVREKDGVRPERRLRHILHDWESRCGISSPAPVCLEGDIRHERFGLSAESILWLRDHVDTMIHNAALVDFASHGSTIWDTNVVGTENCLELCRAARIANLHFVSTAYVCGNRSGTIYEHELDCGQDFRNEYERSKFAAEQMLRTSAIPDSLTVYRPSVVVGDSQDGFATSFRGLYVLAQFTQLIAQHADRDEQGRWHHPVRIDKSGSERRNLIPVDWVARVIGNIVEQRQRHGHTYHIAPSRPVSAAELEAAFRQYFNYYGVDLVGPHSTSSVRRSNIEEMFFNYISTYMPYWDSDPTFDLSNTKVAMSRQQDQTSTLQV